jgi:hypothetical protein
MEKLFSTLGLTHEEDGIYIGSCPFCHLQDRFGIDLGQDGHFSAGCDKCGFETTEPMILWLSLKKCDPRMKYINF